jgi:PAS domain S-box-containing protein
LLTRLSSSLQGSDSWKQIYEQAPVAIGIYLGPQYRIEFANTRMCEIWDKAYEEVKDKPLFDALPEVQEQGFEEILSRVYQTGEDFSGDELPATLRRNGKVELAYFNIVYKAQRNELGQIEGIIQMATEVTELVLARQKAEKRQEMLQLAMENSQMGSWHYDLVQQNFSQTIEFDRIFGYDTLQESWNKEQIFKHILAEDQQLAENALIKGLESGVIEHDVRIKRLDKSICWVQVRGKITYNLKRQPVSLSGIIHDISQQKEMAERDMRLASETAARLEAERQRSRLNELFMKAPTLICMLEGPELVYELVNDLYAQLFPDRELLGKPLLEALPELAGHPISDIIQKVYESGESYVGHEVAVAFMRDGVYKKSFFDLIYQAMRDSAGNITGVLAFAHEVTDSLLARREIELSERRLRMALEAGKMGSYHITWPEQIVIHSQQHARIFGFDEPKVGWTNENFLEYVLPEYQALVRNSMTKAIETGNLYFEAQIQTDKGEKRWVSVKGQTIYEQDRKASGITGIIADITEDKLAKEQLKSLSDKLSESNQELMCANEEVKSRNEALSETNRQLKRINADLDNFVYTASHDLRAPVANIEGLLETLRISLPKEVQEQRLVNTSINYIKSSVERLRLTIDELTGIAKVQKDVEERLVFDAKIKLKEVVEDLQLSIQQANIDLQLELEEEEIQIDFSTQNFKSLVYNLLSNAIKYRNQNEKPWIKLKLYQDNQQSLVLQVSDNGMGIDEKDQDKIFLMFKRIHRHIEGSGVGLYLVKRIVENAGGTIVLESEVNKGSTFTISLPQVSEGASLSLINEI